MHWVDLEKEIYSNLGKSHYGMWPRIDEINEEQEEIDTYRSNLTNRIYLSIGRGSGKSMMTQKYIEEEIKEEQKMKNIKWKARRVRYDHEDQEFVVELAGALNGMIATSNGLRDIADYVEGRLSRDNRVHTTYNPDRIIPEIKDVIFNGPATIVLWKDGTKTVVKAQEGEVIDYEKGMAMAIAKRMLGNKGSYYDAFTKYLPKEDAE